MKTMQEMLAELGYADIKEDIERLDEMLEKTMGISEDCLRVMDENVFETGKIKNDGLYDELIEFREKLVAVHNDLFHASNHIDAANYALEYSLEYPDNKPEEDIDEE